MISPSEIAEILAENTRRLKAGAAPSYDPLIGCPDHDWRIPVRSPWESSTVYIPRTMVRDPRYSDIRSKAQYQLLRCRHDFEYWAATCVTITHKTTCREIPFVLNAPQRILLAELERQRQADMPIRIILLKARQWGGSTLIQIYMDWIQILHRTRWNSIICSHVRGTASQLRSDLRRILRTYPAHLWPFDARPALAPWESMPETRVITGSDSTVTVTSTVAQDAIRGLPFSMAHLSEVAFWKDSNFLSPEDYIRSISGGIAMVPYSMIVMESTANGTGNFFHSCWNEAVSGHSAYTPLFIPWYCIELYSLPCPDPAAFVAEWDDFRLRLWNLGLTIEQIYWYNTKAREITSPEALRAEYPTTADEAFTATNHSVFDTDAVERLRSGCRAPLPLSEIFSRYPAARHLQQLICRDAVLRFWDLPPMGRNALRCPADRFIVAVDVGGRSLSSDYSVITVFDRLGCAPGRTARVVAQWRGHTDHDILARYAEALARFFADALLIIESNALESSPQQSSQYILEQLNERYSNLYVRRSRDSARHPVTDSRVGFHTNRASKSAAIANLIRIVRDGLYEENSPEALNEFLVYQVDSSGAFGAKRGHHDDMLICRAIALYVIDSLPPLSPPGFD